MPSARGVQPVLGVDEAGRGPVLGPLVVAAVLVRDPSELQQLGVADSKTLTPVRRTFLCNKIQRIVDSEVVELPALDIDSLRATMTMNQIEVQLFATVTATLLGRWEGSAVDLQLDAADVNPDRFGSQVYERVAAVSARIARVISEHRADATYPAVSAASIVAKVRRDERIARIEEDLRRLDPRCGPMGSGYPSDPRTVAFMERWIRAHGVLPPHTRATWETARRLLRSVGKQRLEEFGG